MYGIQFTIIFTDPPSYNHKEIFSAITALHQAVCTIEYCCSKPHVGGTEHLNADTSPLHSLHGTFPS